jgi:hypothetical protein
MGLPVFGLTNDIGWGGGSVYFASKLLGFINIQANSLTVWSLFTSGIL